MDTEETAADRTPSSATKPLECTKVSDTTARFCDRYICCYSCVHGVSCRDGTEQNATQILVIGFVNERLDKRFVNDSVQ